MIWPQQDFISFHSHAQRVHGNVSAHAQNPQERAHVQADGAPEKSPAAAASRQLASDATCKTRGHNVYRAKQFDLTSGKETQNQHYRRGNGAKK
jgi:hypothetical protein